MTRYLSADGIRLTGQPVEGVLRIELGRVDVVPEHAVPDGRPDGHVAGTVVPGIRDSHVHLGLVAPERLAGTQLAGVVDLGWIPEQARAWTEHDDLDVRIAGAFLAAPGGYPSQQGWASPAAVRAVADAADAGAAVAEQLALGAQYAKITLNSVAGPVHDDATLAALVQEAHRAGIPSVVHAEGDGQAERAFAAGAVLLAHTPWTERLADELVSAMAARMAWISTTDIHGWGEQGEDHTVAVDNLRRFTAAGGTVLYGTDLGNGPLPEGLNERELRTLVDVGLDVDALLRAVGGLPFLDRAVTVLDGALPSDPADLVPMLMASRPTPLADLGR